MFRRNGRSGSESEGYGSDERVVGPAFAHHGLVGVLVPLHLNTAFNFNFDRRERVHGAQADGRGGDGVGEAAQRRLARQQQAHLHQKSR